MAVLAAGLARTAWAADPYPSRTIRLVVPFPAGGTFDGLARLFADKLGAAWKQAVVVDNKPGAGTILGSAQVAKSPGDGYTVLFGASGLAQNPALYPKMPYAPSELLPVAKLFDMPFALVVNAAQGIGSVAEFIAQAKAAKGAMTCAQISTTSQAMSVIFQRGAAIDLVQVPYKGEAPGTTDLLGGQVNAAFISPGAAAAHAGKLKVLAVTGATRIQRLPGVPTFEELGFPGLKRGGWGGVFVPSSTPRPIVDQLSAEFVRIGASADAVERTQAAGYAVAAADSRDFTRFVDSEYEYWKRVFQQFNIKAE